MPLYYHQVSKLMIFSIVVMIIGLTIATPLSLLLTIPAYILADRVSISISIHSKIIMLHINIIALLFIIPTRQTCCDNKKEVH